MGDTQPAHGHEVCEIATSAATMAWHGRTVAGSFQQWKEAAVYQQELSCVSLRLLVGSKIIFAVAGAKPAQQ